VARLGWRELHRGSVTFVSTVIASLLGARKPDRHFTSRPDATS